MIGTRSNALWDDVSPLFATQRPRIAFMASRGIPETTDRSHELVVVRANAGYFQERGRRAEVLNLIARRARVDPDVWLDQWEFLHRLLESYYSAPGIASDTPAWIKIAPARRSFPDRLKAATERLEHSAQLSRKLYPAASLGDRRLRINQQLLDTDGLLMCGPLDVPLWDLHVREMRIVRRVRYLNTGRFFATPERWVFLSSGDPAERQALRQGHCPVTEQFRERDTGIQRSPLISLCQMSGDGGLVQNRCFSLATGSGRIVDFRDSVHDLEYYLQSDGTNHELLKRTLSAEESEVF